MIAGLFEQKSTKCEVLLPLNPLEDSFLRKKAYSSITHAIKAKRQVLTYLRGTK